MLWIFSQRSFARLFLQLSFFILLFTFLAEYHLAAQMATPAEAESTQSVDSIGSSTPISDCSLALTLSLMKIGWMGSNGGAFHATGSLTHVPGAAGEAQSKIEVWADATGRYRSEIGTGNGSHITIAVNGRGLRKNSTDSNHSRISPQTAQSAQQWIAPWLVLDRLLPLHTCTPPRASSTAEQGLVGYRFELKQSMRNLPLGSQRPFYDTTFTLWMNSASGLPDHIEFFMPASDNPYAGTWVTRFFKEFEAEHGVLIPRVEDMAVGGNTINSLRFEHVEVMDQLPSALFAELQGSIQ